MRLESTSFLTRFASLLSLSAVLAACSIDASVGEGGEGSSNDGTSPGGSGNTSSDPRDPDGGSTPKPPTPCAAAPRPGVDAPVELATNLDFHPTGAFVDSQHRAVVYGWANESGYALPDLFVARYSTTGALDTSFGKGTGYALFDLLDDSNGLPVGLSATVDDSDRIVLVWGRSKRTPQDGRETVVTAMRTKANGSLDSSFGNEGYVEQLELGLGTTIDSTTLATKSTKLYGSNGIATLPGGGMVIVAVTQSSMTDFTSSTIKETTQITGVKLTAGGVREPAFNPNLPMTTPSITTLRVIGSDVFVSNLGAVNKLTASGAPDPSFSLSGAMSLPDAFARRADGTYLASSNAEIVATDANGKNPKPFAKVSGRLALRCDGSVVVASSATDVATAQLLAANGSVDTTRGTKGVVSYAKAADLSTSMATAIDPSTGTVTQFYSRRKQGVGDALIAVRLHP